MRSKQDRLNTIRQIIDTTEISTQEELIAELEKRGFDVTQATVSRDISDLGLQKVRIIQEPGDLHSARQVYSLPEIERLRSLLTEFMSIIDRANNLIVIKTAPGMAQAIAAATDAVAWPDVLGTVGGDDTILIISRNSDVAAYMVKRLTTLSREKAF
ncbi:MAG TPA: arginine repressor [Candidatus Aquicultor sp.]|jgi:transcriptional regulator of arginine metabolism